MGDTHSTLVNDTSNTTNAAKATTNRTITMTKAEYKDKMLRTTNYLSKHGSANLSAHGIHRTASQFPSCHDSDRAAWTEGTEVQVHKSGQWVTGTIIRMTHGRRKARVRYTVNGDTVTQTLRVDDATQMQSTEEFHRVRLQLSEGCVIERRETCASWKRCVVTGLADETGDEFVVTDVSDDLKHSEPRTYHRWSHQIRACEVLVNLAEESPVYVYECNTKRWNLGFVTHVAEVQRKDIAVSAPRDRLTDLLRVVYYDEHRKRGYYTFVHRFSGLVLNAVEGVPPKRKYTAWRTYLRCLVQLNPMNTNTRNSHATLSRDRAEKEKAPELVTLIERYCLQHGGCVSPDLLGVIDSFVGSVMCLESKYYLQAIATPVWSKHHIKIKQFKEQFKGKNDRWWQTLNSSVHTMTRNVCKGVDVEDLMIAYRDLPASNGRPIGTYRRPSEFDVSVPPAITGLDEQEDWNAHGAGINVRAS